MNKEILEITKKFHDTYEKLSKEYNYETRKETRVFDINSSNGKLMYATVNEIISPILKEIQELKQKYLNAVADYETTMFEKEQLNSLVNSCQEEIRKLKEQLAPNYYVKGLEGTLKEYQQEMNKVAIQQKEFIKYLEEEIKTLEKDILETIDDMDAYMKEVKSLIIEEILQKYKEITGVSDENNIK